jgi:hypothetical protein
MRCSEADISDERLASITWHAYLRATRKHAFAGLQTSATGFLDLLDFRSSFADQTPHSIVRYNVSVRRPSQRHDGPDSSFAYLIVTARLPGTDG